MLLIVSFNSCNKYEGKMKMTGEKKSKGVVEIINLICFSITLISILAGVTISILAVWTSLFNEEYLMRTLITVAILFFASLLISVTVSYFPPLTKQ